MALKSQGVWEQDIPLMRGLARRTEPRCSVPALIHWLLVEECIRRDVSVAAATAEGEALRDDTENDATTGSTA